MSFADISLRFVGAAFRGNDCLAGWMLCCFGAAVCIPNAFWISDGDNRSSNTVTVFKHTIGLDWLDGVDAFDGGSVWANLGLFLSYDTLCNLKYVSISSTFSSSFACSSPSVSEFDWSAAISSILCSNTFGFMIIVFCLATFANGMTLSLERFRVRCGTSLLGVFVAVPLFDVSFALMSKNGDVNWCIRNNRFLNNSFSLNNSLFVLVTDDIFNFDRQNVVFLRQKEIVFFSFLFLVNCDFSSCSFSFLFCSVWIAYLKCCVPACKFHRWMPLCRRHSVMCMPNV